MIMHVVWESGVAHKPNVATFQDIIWEKKGHMW